MFLQLTRLPKRDEDFILACSGGVDSMAAAHFLSAGGRSFTLGYFNHATPQANEFQHHVETWGKSNGLKVEVGKLENHPPKGESVEAFWRKARYRWLESFGKTIVTCHHLDDAVEGWVLSSLHGEGKVIPFQRKGNNCNVLRPFLLNTKADMMEWCKYHNVQWVDDESNQDLHHSRNRIRHVILPHIRIINPGISKVIKKKILRQVHEALNKT